MSTETDYHWRWPLDKFELGTKFGVVDAQHPNGHRGTDFNGVPVGTPIKALADCKVAKVLTSKVLGNIVVLQVGSKYFGHCHMNRPTRLKEGMIIKAGTQIGEVGNTGTASSGPHLHLTLGLEPLSVIQGSVMDPYETLKAKIEEGKAKK